MSYHKKNGLGNFDTMVERVNLYTGISKGVDSTGLPGASIAPMEVIDDPHEAYMSGVMNGDNGLQREMQRRNGLGQFIMPTISPTMTNGSMTYAAAPVRPDTLAPAPTSPEYAPTEYAPISPTGGSRSTTPVDSMTTIKTFQNLTQPIYQQQDAGTTHPTTYVGSKTPEQPPPTPQPTIIPPPPQTIPPGAKPMSFEQFQQELINRGGVLMMVGGEPVGAVQVNCQVKIVSWEHGYAYEVTQVVKNQRPDLAQKLTDAVMAKAPQCTSLPVGPVSPYDTSYLQPEKKKFPWWLVAAAAGVVYFTVK
jgi:hypothetical protein